MTDINLRTILTAAFADCLSPDATDSTIDDAIADINELAAADILTNDAADTLILALHTIAELDDSELDASAMIIPD